MAELLSAFGAVILFMSGLWYYGYSKNNYNIVDVGWTFSLWICMTVYFILSEGIPERNILLFLFVTSWSFRLGLYLLFSRVLGDHKEDARYNEFRVSYGDSVHRKFFTNIFMFQGFLDIFLSLPFFLILNSTGTLGMLDFFGFFLCFTGLAGETIADRQLHSFKSDERNKGRNCETGLWYYSRHPNYFFEWVIWVGYAVLSFNHNYGFLGLISAGAMFYFLTQLTGIKMSEKQSLLKRPEEYALYQKTTSAFFPWFKKKML